MAEVFHRADREASVASARTRYGRVSRTTEACATLGSACLVIRDASSTHGVVEDPLDERLVVEARLGGGHREIVGAHE